MKILSSSDDIAIICINIVSIKESVYLIAKKLKYQKLLDKS